MVNAAPRPADRILAALQELTAVQGDADEWSARPHSFAAPCVAGEAPLTLSTALSFICDHAGYTPALAQAGQLELYGGPAAAADSAALAETIRAASLGDPGLPHGPPRHRRSRRARRRRARGPPGPQQPGGADARGDEPDFSCAPVPAELQQFQPPNQVTLSATATARALRECKRGSALGLSGARPEHYKLLLEHSDATALRAEAATGLARAAVPHVIAEALAMTRMMALQYQSRGRRADCTVACYAGARSAGHCRLLRWAQLVPLHLPGSFPAQIAGSRANVPFFFYGWAPLSTVGGMRTLKRTQKGVWKKKAHTGIAANRGKTRVFNFAGGPASPRVAELGPDVRRGDKPLTSPWARPSARLSNAEYTRAWGTDRLGPEDALLRQLPQMPDLQCAWLLLSYCTAPRPNPHDPRIAQRTVCRGA